MIDKLNNFDWNSLSDIKTVTIPLWLLVIIVILAIKGLFK